MKLFKTMLLSIACVVASANVIASEPQELTHFKRPKIAIKRQSTTQPQFNNLENGLTHYDHNNNHATITVESGIKKIIVENAERFSISTQNPPTGVIENALYQQLQTKQLLLKKNVSGSVVGFVSYNNPETEEPADIALKIYTTPAINEQLHAIMLKDAQSFLSTKYEFCTYTLDTTPEATQEAEVKIQADKKHTDAARKNAEKTVATGITPDGENHQSQSQPLSLWQKLWKHKNKTIIAATICTAFCYVWFNIWGKSTSTKHG